jgi:hypothetical protein
MAVAPPTTPRRGTWGGSRAAAVWRHRDRWATRGVCLALEGRACAPLLDLAHLGWITPASGTGARRSAMHMHWWRLRRGKRMASNFSVLQRRL